MQLTHMWHDDLSRNFLSLLSLRIFIQKKRKTKWQKVIVNFGPHFIQENLPDYYAIKTEDNDGFLLLECRENDSNKSCGDCNVEISRVNVLEDQDQPRTLYGHFCLND